MRTIKILDIKNNQLEVRAYGEDERDFLRLAILPGNAACVIYGENDHCLIKVFSYKSRDYTYYIVYPDSSVQKICRILHDGYNDQREIQVLQDFEGTLFAVYFDQRSWIKKISKDDLHVEENNFTLSGELFAIQY